MAKNVQGVIFLRNGNLFNTRKAALAVLSGDTLLNRLNDGEMALARYGSDNNVKTLAGIMYKTSSGQSITIIDVEGASEDVQELREQMEATFGSGVTTANTATAQLAALSGNTASTSAETSVEGAKRYADDLISTLDGGVTAETGYFVKSVSEVDGKISGTIEALPSYDDAAVAKKFVIAVDETNGKIAVERGEISSSAKTIVLNDNTDGGIDFDVNIDNSTIVKNADTGVISVASAALTQYVGDEDAIHVSDVDANNKKTISSLLTISATTPTETNVKEQYNLVGASGNTIGATIKIYKDSALLSVALLHADFSDPANPVLPTYNKATNTWTDISSPTEENLALCYAYEDVNGDLQIVAIPVGDFLRETEFASGVTWDAASGKVKGVVDTTSESFLTVGADGFKLSGVQNAINAAVADLYADESGSTEHITVNVVEENGVVTKVTVEEDNIANAADLAALSGKTITAVTSTNGSIAATISNEAGNKTADIQTDADKIQMSGFSAGNTTALSGIAESDSIATAFEKTNAVITENERVTAAALTDLDGRLDVIEPIYVSGVSVNGNAVKVTDHVAPISIQAATGTPTGTITDPAIIVNNNTSTGEVTLGIGYIDCGTYD